MTRRIRFLLYVCCFMLVSSGAAWGQQSTSTLNQPLERTLLARNDISSARGRERERASIEKDRDQLDALVKRKKALQRYLLSVSPTSQDFRVTEAAIKELDARLSSVEQRIRGIQTTRPNANSPASTEAKAPFTGTLLPSAPKAYARPAPGAPAVQASAGFQGLGPALVNILQAKIDQTSNTKQTEAPSISENSTSLVDQSSASDLVGVALNLAGLSAKSGDDEKEADNVSVTTSAYALYSGLQGVDPLNPVFYNENRAWRKVFFTLGYDDEKLEGTETTERAKIYGAKIMLIDKRDPSLSRYDQIFDQIRLDATTAGTAFANITVKAQAFLFRDARVRQIITTEFRPTLVSARDAAAAAMTAAGATPAQVAAAQAERDRLNALITQFDAGGLFVLAPNGRIAATSSLEERVYFADFINRYLSPSATGVPAATLSTDILKDLNDLLEREASAELSTFTNLNQNVVNLIQTIRKAPQLSFAFFTKQREKGNVDDYRVEVIYDYGLGDRVNLTLSGGFEYKNSRLIGADTRGGLLAGQLQFRFNKQPESLSGKKPVYFFLATNNKWGTGMKPQYKLQGKLQIPIADGFEIPLSVTYANRTELNEEKTVRGQFGFTFDTARLFRAFLSQ